MLGFLVRQDRLFLRVVYLEKLNPKANNNRCKINMCALAKGVGVARAAADPLLPAHSLERSTPQTASTGLRLNGVPPAYPPAAARP